MALWQERLAVHGSESLAGQSVGTTNTGFDIFLTYDLNIDSAPPMLLACKKNCQSLRSWRLVCLSLNMLVDRPNNV